MGIVRFALKFPYTFYVLAALILFLGLTAITVMPIDIFPEINIPVVSVIWQYTGLSTTEMEQRVTTYSQYSISSNVNGIKDMEAQTLNGISVQKIYFQPGVNLDLAISQIVSATNSIRALMPAGIQPPTVVAYNASSVPVLQLSLSSDQLNEQQLYDYGIYNLRQQLAPVPGVTFPTPDGGKYRQIMVDIDPFKLEAKGLTPADVVNAVNAQNLTLPSGLAKIGDTQYTVRTNAMPTTIAELNDIPIKYVNGQTVFVRDIGQVHDGWAVQQNIVRENGRRSVLLSVIKNGGASTLAVVDGVRKVLKIAREAAPPGLSNQRTVRSVEARDRFDRKRGPRRGDRSRADGADDPIVSRLMAVDPDRVDLDSAVDPDVDRGPVLPRPYAQHHDARRHGARGRHSGRRFDGDDREHPPPARRRHEPCGGDAARLRGHRRPDVGLDARDQLRVYLGGVPGRTGEIPVHAAWACGGVRNAGVLYAVENIDAPDHRPLAQG
jgi:AcrB/AcrD/AcrF family